MNCHWDVIYRCCSNASLTPVSYTHLDVYKRQDEELLPFIPDYRINLLAPREITDFTGFRTSIRQLFEVLKNSYDKEKMQEVLQNDEKFSNVDRETVEAINLFAGTDIDIRCV